MLIDLHDGIAREYLRKMAYSYAYISIERVATVRWSPRIDEAREARWRALRATLQSTQMPGNELPNVPEPVWRSVYDLGADYRIVKPGKITKVGGLSMCIGTERALKKSAKPKPSYNRNQTSKAAEEWAAAFVAWMCDEGPPVEMALRAAAEAA